MKCPNCAAMCMPTDTVCFGCKKPLKVHWDTPNRSSGAKLPVSQRVSMIFACLGAALMPAAMGLEPYAVSNSIDFTAAHWAGVGGAIGGLFGLAIGSLLERKKAKQ